MTESELIQIYMPLLNEFMNGISESHKNDKWFANFENIKRVAKKTQCELNTAYKSGLYEGYNNGFVEGFIEAAKYFKKIK